MCVLISWAISLTKLSFWFLLILWMANIQKTAWQPLRQESRSLNDSLIVYCPSVIKSEFLCQAWTCIQEIAAFLVAVKLFFGHFAQVFPIKDKKNIIESSLWT